MIKPKYYFTIGPVIYTGVNCYLTIININWNYINITTTIFYFITHIIATLSISEIFLTYMLILFTKNSVNNYAVTNNIIEYPIIINYNLKAFTNRDIDQCFSNMYDAYINNVFNNTTAVLISVTDSIELKEYEKSLLYEYRKKIVNFLSNKGEEYLKHPNTNPWWKNYYITSDKLLSFCNEKANNFILIFRETNVLKKCGQYQDLICFTQGYDKPYTYNDFMIYGTNIRVPNKMFTFLDRSDYDTLYNKKHKYTLVLDSDSIVPDNFLEKIVNIAEIKNEYDIYQPKIQLVDNKTIFQNIQKIWLENSNLSYTTISNYFNHSAFFGKGLINNKKYLEKCIGTPDNLIEYVPANAVSHDTFEAMCMNTVYIPECSLYEVSPKTYLSWNFREIRWSIGELIVASHIFPKLWKAHYKMSRHNYHLSFNKMFFALSSFRILIMWPILLIFIILNSFMPFYNYYTSFIYIISTTIVIPNLIKLYYGSKNIHIYIVTSIIHVLPEPLIGTTRLITSLYKIIKGNFVWLPSTIIELSLSKQNNLKSSIYYFGTYSIISTTLLVLYYNLNFLLSLFLVSIICLPLYNIFSNFKTIKPFKIRLRKIKIIK